MMETSTVGEYCERLVCSGALKREAKLDASGRNVYAYSTAGPRDMIAQIPPRLHSDLARVYRALKKAGTARNKTLCAMANTTANAVSRDLAALEKAGFAERKANENFESWRASPTDLDVDEVAVLTRLRGLLRPVRLSFLEDEAGRGLEKVVDSLVKKKLVANRSGLVFALERKKKKNG